MLDNSHYFYIIYLTIKIGKEKGGTLIGVILKE
jgi:hypothetical protein